MFKYIATAAAAALLLAVALKSGTAQGVEPLDVSHGTPDHVSVRKVGDGYVVEISHRLAGAVSRASLVYEDESGTRRTAAQDTDCQKSLATAGGIAADGYATKVALKANLPDDARRVRFVLENETGTHLFRVPLD